MQIHLKYLSFAASLTSLCLLQLANYWFLADIRDFFFLIYIHRELSTCQRFPLSPQGWEELNSMAGENKLLRTVPYCAESNTEIQMRANSAAKASQHCVAWNASRQKQEETWHPWYPKRPGTSHPVKCCCWFKVCYCNVLWPSFQKQTVHDEPLVLLSAISEENGIITFFPYNMVLGNFGGLHIK